MNISQKLLYRISLVYIYIPIFLIVIGWCKPMFALFATLLMILSLYYSKGIDKPEIKHICLSKKEILVLISLILFFAYLFGWGGMTPQSGDWDKHNAILRDLTLRDWPVYFHNGQETSLLTYYIGQYSLSAFVGKVSFHLLNFIGVSSFIGIDIADFSFYIAEIVLMIWNIVGLMITKCHLFFLINSNKNKILIFIIFIFFGNPLILGQFIYGTLVGTYDFGIHWLDINHLIAQYSTNFVLLRWVFQHCICTWIVTAILMEKMKDIDSFVVLGLPLVLYSPFAFIGILIYMITIFIKRIFEVRKINILLTKIFSRQNLFSLFSLGVFCFCYFISYFIQEGKPEEIGFSLISFSNYKTILAYVLFCLFTYGIISIILYKYYKKEVGFWNAIITLTILPFFKVGVYNDLVMRASIPALFILCVYCIKLLMENNYKMNNLYKNLLIIVLIIGSYYPLKEMSSVLYFDNIFDLQERNDDTITLENYANRYTSSNSQMTWNYNTFDVEESIFKRTIGK